MKKGGARFARAFFLYRRVFSLKSVNLKNLRVDAFFLIFATLYSVFQGPIAPRRNSVISGLVSVERLRLLYVGETAAASCGRFAQVLLGARLGLGFVARRGWVC